MPPLTPLRYASDVLPCHASDTLRLLLLLPLIDMIRFAAIDIDIAFADAPCHYCFSLAFLFIFRRHFATPRYAATFAAAFR